MLLVGPAPGTGKTTTAEALGKIYAGAGHSCANPEIIEVKRADFCGRSTSVPQARKTNALIARSLGRVLFMDEFYSFGGSVIMTGAAGT